MKKTIALLFLTAAAALIFSACASAGQAGSTDPGGAPAAGTPAPGELSQPMKLAIGTLKLEGGEHAVNAEQAKALLPLWKAVRSLSGSSSAAAEEVRGLFNQIEKTMSADQLAEIDAMQIGMQDLGALGEQFGFETGGRLQGTPDPGLQATMQAMRATRQASGESFGGPLPGVIVPGGGMGPGGEMGPGGGFVPGGASGLSEEARATLAAQRGASGTRIGVPSGLTEAIIRLLEARAGS